MLDIMVLWHLAWTCCNCVMNKTLYKGFKCSEYIDTFSSYVMVVSLTKPVLVSMLSIQKLKILFSLFVESVDSMCIYTWDFFYLIKDCCVVEYRVTCECSMFSILNYWAKLSMNVNSICVNDINLKSRIQVEILICSSVCDLYLRFLLF